MSQANHKNNFVKLYFYINNVLCLCINILVYTKKNICTAFIINSNKIKIISIDFTMMCGFFLYLTLPFTV